MVSYSITAVPRLYSASFTVLALIIMKIPGIWVVTQVNPVEIYTFGEIYFSHHPKSKKICTSLYSAKTKNKAIFETFQFADNYVIFSLRNIRVIDLCFITETRSSIDRKTFDNTLRHGYCRTYGFQKRGCGTNRKLRKVYHLLNFFFCELETDTIILFHW
jgi:hypothetical protein